jgi:hypothetical protein
MVRMLHEADSDDDRTSILALNACPRNARIPTDDRIEKDRHFMVRSARPRRFQPASIGITKEFPAMQS